MVQIKEFYSDDCINCRLMKKELDKLTNVQIDYINVDVEPENAVAFHVDILPTMVILKNMEIVDTITGMHSAEEIQGIIDALDK